MPRVLLLVSVALVLSGCVWSRLLDWKEQLKDFDRYVTAVDVGPALLMSFNQPCIRPADIGYLLGGDQPSKRSAREGGGIWVSWQLRRDRTDSFGVELALGAADDGEDTPAESLLIPPQVLSFIPKQRLLATARAFGSANIDKGKREAAADISGIEAKPIAINRTNVTNALGEPDTSERLGDVDRLTFHFKLVQPDGSLGKGSDLILDLRGDMLVAARLKAPNFNAWMKFDHK